MSETTLLQNGLVVDGTGKAGYRADVLIEGETIVRIGAVDPAAAERIIECSGTTVAPRCVLHRGVSVTPGNEGAVPCPISMAS